MASVRDDLVGDDLTAVRRRVQVRRDEHVARWPTWTPRTFAGHFSHCAERWGDAPYLISDGQAWSYVEFAGYLRRAADAFYAAGIRRGDRVALLLDNSAEFFALKFALSQFGALAVGLNYMLGARELAFTTGNSAPKMIVLDPLIAGRDMVSVLSEAGVIVDGGRDDLTVVVRKGDLAGRAPSLTLDEFLAAGEGTAAPDDGDPEDPSELMYTSGSTGTPKGVILHSDALLRESYGTALIRGLELGVASMTALPPFHLYGLAQAVLPPSFVGGSVRLQTRFDAEAQIGFVQAGQVTDIVGVANMFYRIIDILDARTGPDAAVDALRSVYIGGDAVTEQDWRRIREVLGVDEITAGFGMTEIQGTSFIVPPGSTDEALANTVGWETRAGCAGRPEFEGVKHEWRLVDLETRQPVGKGEVGELQYRGPSVSRGYWNLGVDDRSRLDGWFSSGDVGRVRPDGALVFQGRNSDVYRTGGELVSPREVEKVISEVPGVVAAYVVGVPDRRWGQMGCAWVVPTDAESAIELPALVEEHCRERLARYQVPKSVLLIDAADVPLSPSGKIRKSGLVELAVARIGAVGDGA